MNEDDIIRLLKATSGIRIPEVIALRRGIAKYVNSAEHYISQLEMDNLQLTRCYYALEECRKHEQLLRKLYLYELNDKY